MFYSNSFTCIPLALPYRPPNRTPKPFIAGVQNALVTGPSGKEVFTDKYGRIKVQFYWDRDGKNDENSSCWIRVAQTFAGKRWGGSFWPRLAQEVLVAFVEGNPDVGGSRASMAMMAAEVLGIPYDRVRAIVADTGSIGFTFLTGGSRVTFATGMAVTQAAEKVVTELKSRAAAIWDISPEAVEWKDGKAFPAGATLLVNNPRGDVTISGTSDDNQIHVSVHKEVYTRSDSDADAKAQRRADQRRGVAQRPGRRSWLCDPCLRC